MVRIIHRLATCLKECSHPPRISHSSIIVFPCVCVCVFQLIHHLWPFIPSLLRIYSGNQDPGSHSFLPPPHATACRLENRHIRQNGLSPLSRRNQIGLQKNLTLAHTLRAQLTLLPNLEPSYFQVVAKTPDDFNFRIALPFWGKINSNSK